MAHDLHDDDIADGLNQIPSRGWPNEDDDAMGNENRSGGYDDGHSDGYEAGHTAGYGVGFEAGREAGREEAAEDDAGASM